MNLRNIAHFCKPDSAENPPRRRGVTWPGIERPIGRKPPPLAEVGQSIFPKRMIGIVSFMEVKELRGAAGLRVWHGNCSAISTRIPL